MIPEKWLLRDPRNPDHIRAAVQLIATLGKVITDPQQTDVVVCTFYFLDRPLLLPDNLIRTCVKCHTPVQIRPSNDVGKSMCLFCVVDELLNEYWSNKDK